MKIISKLPGSIIKREMENAGDKINYIAFGMTTKAIKPIVDLHGRMLVVMKRTAHHSVALYRKTIEFSCFLHGNSLLHISKNAHCHSSKVIEIRRSPVKSSAGDPEKESLGNFSSQ